MSWPPSSPTSSTGDWFAQDCPSTAGRDAVDVPLQRTRKPCRFENGATAVLCPSWAQQPAEWSKEAEVKRNVLSDEFWVMATELRAQVRQFLGPFCSWRRKPECCPPCTSNSRFCPILQVVRTTQRGWSIRTLRETLDRLLQSSSSHRPLAKSGYVGQQEDQRLLERRRWYPANDRWSGTTQVDFVAIVLSRQVRWLHTGNVRYFRRWNVACHLVAPRSIWQPAWSVAVFGPQNGA